MEYGYFHQDRGYWQATNKPSQNVLAGYPAGTVEIPLRPVGDFKWDGSDWVEQPPDLDALVKSARAKRDRLLARSDWTQVADAPVNQAAWATYRQSLRDITQQDGFPNDVTWPVAPN
tara:strand:+ start:2136 stop:2486 length:351 start_codon:yes stop_codon:yes gene_type:complete